MPDDHSGTVEVLLAAQATRQNPQHPHGYLRGESFTFDEAPSTRLKEIAARQRPPVVTRERSSDEYVSVEVLPTGATPQRIVLYYVGDKDPHEFTNSAKEVITGLMGQVSGQESSLPPTIIVLGHPNARAEESKLAVRIQNDFTASRRTKDMPADTTLLIQDPVDKPALVAALRWMRLDSLKFLSHVTRTPLAQLRAATDEQIDVILQQQKTEYGAGEDWYQGWASTLRRSQQLMASIRTVADISDVYPMKLRRHLSASRLRSSR